MTCKQRGEAKLAVVLTLLVLLASVACQTGGYPLVG